MATAAWLGRYRFASGADEKVTRVFDAPQGFVGSLSGLGVVAAADQEQEQVVRRPHAGCAFGGLLMRVGR